MSEYLGMFFPFMDEESEKKMAEKEKGSKGPARIRGVSWNRYQGNKDFHDNLVRLIKDTARPHFLALQECFTDPNVKIKGYRTIGKASGNPRDANCLLIVRDDVELGERRDIDVNGNDWVGPKHGLIQPPRYFPGQTLIANGHPWDVWSVHRCTNGQDRSKPRNMTEWQAEHHALASKAGKREQRRPDRGGLFVGDWNNPPQDRRRFSIRSLANECDAGLNVLGIDGVINWNSRIVNIRKLASKYGSDHHRPVVFMAESR